MRLLLVMLAAAGLLASGCTKKEEATGQQGTGEISEMMVDSTARANPGYEVIPPTDVPEAPLPGLFLNPYFDEAGTQTERSVAPGEDFNLYIMAETVDPYETMSAQMRVVMPPGLNVIYTVETEKKLSSLGRHDFNYMVAYDCMPPGRFVVVSYVCRADADFQGGEIQVLPGFLADNATFLGFATCEFIEVRAAGGTATIRRK